MKGVFALARITLLILIPTLLDAQLVGPPDEEKAKRDVQTHWLKKTLVIKFNPSKVTESPFLSKIPNPTQIFYTNFRF